MGRIFAIGDIHGCLNQLECLMERIPIDWQQDTLVFLGDYIDRGPNPRQVVQFVTDLILEHPEHIVCLRGNHEEMFMDFLFDGELARTFLQFGGTTTLESYAIPQVFEGPKERLIPPWHLEFFQNLRNLYETKDYIFVHAGLRPKVPVKNQRTEDLLWIRDEFIRSRYDWGKRVIFGHTPFDTPLIQSNKIGIDTGAVYGGRLTCLVLPEVEFIFA